MRTVLAAFVVAIVGCGQFPAKPAPSAADPPKWRKLDKAAAEELTKAWADNPVAAEKRYKDVRFRAELRVLQIRPVRCMVTAAEKGVEATFLRFADDEVEKVKTDGTYTFEFVVSDYRRGENTVFEDARVVPSGK